MITITVEHAPMDHAVAFCNLINSLNHHQPATRAQAAQIVRNNNFTAFVSGHSVAIHRADNCTDVRLALVTNDTPDFR